MSSFSVGGPIVVTVTDPGCGWFDSNKANNQHRHKNRQMKIMWRNAAIEAGEWVVKQGFCPVPLRRVAITYVVSRRSDVVSDADNVQPACKAVRDGLVRAGVLEDDHDGIVLGTTYTRGPKAAQATLTVRLSPLPPLGDIEAHLAALDGVAALLRVLGGGAVPKYPTD